MDEAQLVASMSEGLYSVDTRRQITHWNPAAARITGYTAGEVLGRWCGDGLLNHVDDDGQSLCGTRCPLTATMADGVCRTVRVYLHHKDGHVTPVRVSAAPLHDDTGAIVGAVETFSEDDEHTAVVRRLHEAERLADLDPLTSLGNRRYLERALQRRLTDWEREHRPFGLVIADIDHFKQINDIHGHDIGDRVLQVLARSLLGAVRSGDEVFRFGGEEIVILTGPNTPTDLDALTARLLMVARQSRFTAPDGTPVLVTLSAGATTVIEGDDAPSVLRRADQMLLRAKREGRDRARRDNHSTGER